MDCITYQICQKSDKRLRKALFATGLISISSKCLKKTQIMYPGFGYPNHHYEVRKASKGLYTQINPFTTIYSHNFREDLEARARKIECPS